MKVDLDRLERLAVSATPGPWKATSQKLRPQLPLRIMEVVAAPGEPPIIPWKGFDACDMTKTERLANSRFIAAANPAVVLELARRLREAEKDAARLDFIESNLLETDSAGDWNEEPTFGVHRISGGRNDRNWHCLGRGETLRAAIDAAMQSPKNER